MNLKSRNKIDPSFSMSSMTDIVFLLLIFFLLTSTMVQTNVLDLKLPSANGTSIVEQPTTVSITNEGIYFLNGASLNQDQLETKLIENLEGKEKKNFVLEAEENTYTKDLVYVMDIANRNKWNMVLATQPKK